ncbi:MAG: fasciclin domain-containing protein, partial [Nocardioides sp.]
MKSTTFRKATGIAAVALTASFSLAACGSDSSSSSATGSDTGSTSKAAADAGAQTFGPGCSAIPSSGDGSFNGMATAPVASAASANPLLKT